MAAPGERRYVLRLVFSIIGIIVGLSVCAVFGVQYKNWNTSLWGLASALPAAITLFVHVCCKRRRWESCPERLKSYMLAGCFIQLAGVCGFVTYLTLGITLNQELKANDDGYFLTCIWCFMTWKWGFFLFYFSRKYYRSYVTEYKGLVKETATVADYGS